MSRRSERRGRVFACMLAASCCAGQTTEATVMVTTGIATPEAEPEAELVYAPIEAAEVSRRLWPQPAPSAYAPASAEQATALRELIGRMMGGRLAGLAAAAEAAGYAVEGWEIGGERFVAAVERSDGRRGGGAFVVRVGSTSPVILQAPHAFFDLGTERIAVELMFAERGWPRALFVNTVHRYLGADGVKRRAADAPADPCHREEHLFAVATAAAVEQVPGAEVVQLHGFGDDPDDGDGPAFAAIVSGGAATPTPRSRAVAERLRAELGVKIGLYPVDTDRLGATTNVQGRAIRAYNERTGAAATFVHVELAASLRQQLRADAEARRRLAAALRPPTSGM